MKTFIKYLEKRIEGCEALGGMGREKSIYQSVLKEYKKQLTIPCVSKSFAVGADVIVTDNIHGHGFKMNEVVELIDYNGRLWEARNDDGKIYWLMESEANVC